MSFLCDSRVKEDPHNEGVYLVTTAAEVVEVEPGAWIVDFGPPPGQTLTMAEAAEQLRLLPRFGSPGEAVASVLD